MTQTTQIGIAGAGRVAQAMGRALMDAGFEIACVASRTEAHTQAAARFLATKPVAYGEVGQHASRVLIAVSDSAIESVAAELASRPGIRIALHTCGAYGAEPLRALAESGASCGTMHPLQTIYNPKEGAAALYGIAFAISGDREAQEWGREMAGALGGTTLHVPPEGRHLYHAAAVMASNYIAVLLDAAKHAMVMAGVPESEALPALGPLVTTSVKNVLREGPAAALTGPVVRGDAATVAAHIRALAPADRDLYRAAGLRALRLARERGLDEETAAAVRQALRGGE